MEETPTEFVRRVRQQTCYGSLRGVIRICALFGYAVGAILIAVAVWSLYERAAHPNSPRSATLQPQILTLIAAVAVFVLTAAAHQASVLLIDIGDTLI